ncbi:MAG: phosphate/phosphite/phosphonate ABC transporter substrate-binding protein [Gammaproteobacteria bacterium]|nr:phosphate/phosphite/phosphonate ABC transporter substrate-binding protein [Gammaproteobacteria bacterium]
MRFCCLLLVMAALASPALLAQDKPYILGVVPQYEVRKLHAIWRPILDHLQQATGYAFELRGSPTIPEFEREFAEGKFDLAYMNPYHLVMANDKAGYIPLVRDHGRQLQGVLVVKKDSGIGSPEQLQGKTVAFPAPNALGASLQMRQELQDRFQVKINPLYVKTHDSVYLSVLMGKAAAGGGVQKTLNQQKPEYREHLQIIHQTTPVPSHPLAVLPSVAAEAREKILQALLQLGETEAGRALLAPVPIKQIGPAEIADYQPLRKLGLERFYQAY